MNEPKAVTIDGQVHEPIKEWAEESHEYRRRTLAAAFAQERLIVLRVPEERAETIGRLVASVLSLNGYGHNRPEVIDPAALSAPLDGEP